MNRADRISGIFWLIFGILVSAESARLGLGTLHRPGPGFLYFYAGIFLSLMALIILVRAFATKSRGPQESVFSGGRIRKALSVLTAVFVYALLMERVGFVPLTLLLFLFILGIIEKKRWWVAVLTSVAVTLAAYLIFETALHSQLPKGLLGSLRF